MLAFGVVGPVIREAYDSSRTHWNVRRNRVRVPYANEGKLFDWYLSRAGHVKPGLKLGGPPSKARIFVDDR